MKYALIPRCTSILILPKIIGFLLFAAFYIQPACAEGPGDFGEHAHGVNRVVRTLSSGYVEVEGNANISFNLPPPNENDNSPSVYLGGTIGGIHFDAGLQYETDWQGSGRLRTRPGWSVFLRGGAAGAAGYTDPRVWQVPAGSPVNTPADSLPWRGPQDAPITSLLRFEFMPSGVVSLHVGAMVTASTPHNSGTFFHYPRGGAALSPDPREANEEHPIAPYQARPAAYFTNTNRTTANVKRVIAMTRANNHNDELDGTTMTAVWSGGRVRRHNEPSLTGSTGNFWQAGAVNQGRNITGYDAAGNGDANRTAWDMRFRRANQWFLTPGPGGSRTTVEFPYLSVGNIEGRTNSPQSHGATEGGNSRYTRETVRINLRRATGARGEAAR